MKNILWIEEAKSQFKAYSYFVRDSFNVQRAEDFKEAIQLIESTVYDLYVVDLIIPSGDDTLTAEEIRDIRDKYYGVELIRLIRRMGIQSPIIVVSVVNESAVIKQIHDIDPSIEIIWKYMNGPAKIRESVEESLSGIS